MVALKQLYHFNGSTLPDA